MDMPNQATPKQPALFARIRNNRLTATFVLLATLSAGILAGSLLTGAVSAKGQQSVDSSDARPLVIPNPRELSNGFAKIAKEVGPAVVNINTESLPKQSTAKRQQPRRRATPAPNTPNDGGDGSDQSPGDMQDFFNRFFGGQNPDGGDDDSGGGKREALGSGFIVDPRGYIITNNHVVDKADHIYVKLSTDPENPLDKGRPAKVVGVDTETDIAVIKIDTDKPLPVAKLGNSDGAQVGDWVLAIGEPFGLSKTVSAGIVSAKDRSIDEPSPNGTANQFQKFIQTDAAINPGNSGGPRIRSSADPSASALEAPCLPPSPACTASPTAAYWSSPSPRERAPTRPESSLTTSSSPSIASPSRMATHWSPTSPSARSVPPCSSAICATASNIQPTSSSAIAACSPTPATPPTKTAAPPRQTPEKTNWASPSPPCRPPPSPSSA